jgi:hypothetical protein
MKKLTKKVIAIAFVAMMVIISAGIGSVVAADQYQKSRDDQWILEKVERYAGEDPSIIIDVNGIIHIAHRYYRSISPGKYAEVKYSKWDGSWSTQVVEHHDGSGPYCWTDIALDSDNKPHVAYEKGFDWGAAKYAKRNGGWSKEEIESGSSSDGMVGDGTAIAVDNNNCPHVVYEKDEPNDQLRYAKKTGGYWNIETVDTDYYWCTDIAVDNYGQPHISYISRKDGGSIRYAVKTGSGWEKETLESNIGLWYDGRTSIAIDDSGYPRITYWGENINCLKYARKTDTGWEIQTVDTVNSDRGTSSLVLDNNGNPHISYFDDDHEKVKYAGWNGSSWDIQIVADCGNGGNAIAIDPSSYIHIAYEDGGSLYHAKSTFTAEPPKLCTDPDPPSHDFGEVPEGETRHWDFEIWNCGEGILTWNVSNNQPWITVSPISGTTATETDIVTVTIDTTGLECDITYTGTVTVSSDGGTKTGIITVYVPEEPSISIYTDKASYTAGNTMHLGLNVTNPSDAQPVRFAIWLMKNGGIYVLTYTSVTLPAGLDYRNPDFMVFTLPGLPSGTYIWHAALIEPSGPIDFISHDTASWEFVPAVAEGPTKDISEALEQTTVVIEFSK